MSPGLRHLRYFVAVADELHFTRAAERLHMSQQPLSAAIRRLEDELGVALFERTTRRVELTDAGRAMLDSARLSVQAADAAFATARDRAEGRAGALRIGLAPGVYYAAQPFLRAVAERRPGLRLDVREDFTGVLTDLVAAAELDVALGFCALPAPGLELTRFRDDPVVCVVARDHPLARRRVVKLADLRDQPFALVGDGAPGYNRIVLELCRAAGFEPETLQDVGPAAWESAVRDRGCVGLTTRSAPQANVADLRVLALRPATTFPLDLVHREGDLRPALRELLTLVPGLSVDEEAGRGRT